MAVMLLSASWVHGADIYISNNVNWSAITGGSGPGGLPSSADNVYTKGNTVTVNVSNAVCASISIGKSGNGGSLVFNSGSVLTVSGNVSFIGNKTNALTMTSGGT